MIDPARVTAEALQNAASIAGTAMTMGALVVDVPSAEPAARWRPRHGHDVALTLGFTFVAIVGYAAPSF